MPAQHRPARRGLRKTPRTLADPEPGIGGYDYPRGPYGRTGFPGSTPAARRTKPQGPDGRRDPSYLGRPTLTATEIRARDTGPEFGGSGPWRVPRPQPSYSEVEFRPGTEAEPGNRFVRRNGTPRLPLARQMRSTAPERR